VQADTIVPDPANLQNLNRHSHVYNRPFNLTEASGHSAVGWDPGYARGYSREELERYMVPEEHVPPEAYWALMAHELGPRNEQGESIINDLYDPFCDLSDARNDQIASDFYHYSGDARFAVSLSVVKKSEATQFGYFLQEIEADEGNLANYEPWWLDELMRQYPQQLMAAQGHWVAKVYLPHPEEWQEYTYRFGGFRPLAP
jgi:hypothetical protein